MQLRSLVFLSALILTGAACAFSSPVQQMGTGGANQGASSSDSTTSVSFAQTARLGALDGLALFARTNVIVDNDRFVLGSVAVTGQAGLGGRWWLLLSGGGGPIGFAYGDLGVKYLVLGDLGPGSFFLTGTLGGAGIFKRTRTFVNTYYVTAKSADYAGPALGLGLEWRL